MDVNISGDSKSAIIRSGKSTALFQGAVIAYSRSPAVNRVLSALNHVLLCDNSGSQRWLRSVTIDHAESLDAINQWFAGASTKDNDAAVADWLTLTRMIRQKRLLFGTSLTIPAGY